MAVWGFKLFPAKKIMNHSTNLVFILLLLTNVSQVGCYQFSLVYMLLRRYSPWLIAKWQFILVSCNKAGTIEQIYIKIVYVVTGEKKRSNLITRLQFSDFSMQYFINHLTNAYQIIIFW